MTDMPDLQLSKRESKKDFDQVEPAELIYEDISVVASVNEQQVVDGKKISVAGQKAILKSCSGKFSPNTFTAILGPSGCGKTTMLNLISGRLLSTNLQLRGILKINGQVTTHIGKYKQRIGYVMQDDFMLPTFTPYECFKFVTDLRMSHLSEEQKVELVNHIIHSLELEKCRDTYVGDTRIRGVSGGEKKRTSIGLQLLINPSILFLDEPTTGLDSTTSLNLIRFLNSLARRGRTIISTIHQPSSEIFMQFNRILLMVDGNIVYDDEASKSMGYFASINMPVPKHTNPTDYYMKMMNKEGLMLNYIEKKQQYTDQQIKVEFGQRVNYLVQNYSRSKKKQLKAEVTTPLTNSFDNSAGWCTQYGYIFRRNWLNQFRQPLDVFLKVFQAIFFGVTCIILYYNKGNTFNEVLQNNQGVLFFLVMNMTFSFVFSSVNLFNFERPVFIRERLSNTYCTSAYYAGRTMAVIPVEIFVPFLFLCIAYFACNLDNSAATFFWTVLSIELCSFMSSSFGLLLSTIFSDASIVMALVPTLIIPFMLVGGFFVPLSTVYPVYYPFEYLSMFRYGFETVVYSQYRDGLTFNGVTYDLLNNGTYSFQLPFWLNLLLMGLIGLFIRVIALFMLHRISNPKIMPLLPPDNDLKQTSASHGKIAEIDFNQTA